MSLGPVRFSHLRSYGRSALHGWHARNNEMEPSAAMERGSAVHAMLLGNKRVVAYPGGVRRGKEWEAFAASNDGAIILSAAEYAKASRMAEAVMECDLAEPLLQGTREETITFRWMGVDCRATPDVRGGDYLTELKTSSSSEPVKFTYHALRMAYHAQMRMQQIAVASKFAMTDPNYRRCFIVAVEDKEPHPVTVLEIDPKALELGERLLVLWMERLKAAEDSQQFPAYSQSIYPLIAPEDIELDYEEAA